MEDPNSPQLSPEYQKLIKYLWGTSPNNSYTPYNFFNIVNRINLSINYFGNNDIKSFVTFIINRLHKELNYIDNSFMFKGYLNPPNQPINQYNSNEVYNSYDYNFKKDNCSIISQYFFGRVQEEVEFKCQNCQNNSIRYNYRTYDVLEFPLGEIVENKASSQIPINEINIMDCFNYYLNDIFCNYQSCHVCGYNGQIFFRKKLYKLPKYLILLFNRYNNTFNIKMTFPEYFNSSNINMNNNDNSTYKLYGVIKYFIYNSNYGKFSAYCRSPKDGCWYYYNNNIVKKIKENDKYKIQEEGITYMLFYTKMNNNFN